MEELVARLTASAGIEQSAASSALVIILKFLRGELAPEVFDKILNVIPEARETLPPPEPKGIMGSMLGGLLGGAGGLMSAMSSLTGAGLSLEQIQTVTREILAFAREKAGPDLVDEVTGEIPQLKMFA